MNAVGTRLQPHVVLTTWLPPILRSGTLYDVHLLNRVYGQNRRLIEAGLAASDRARRANLIVVVQPVEQPHVVIGTVAIDVDVEAIRPNSRAVDQQFLEFAAIQRQVLDHLVFQHPAELCVGCVH